ncbi:MAG: SMP-30/gluconolactonase/LRE family protein [Vicinamibacterales bacterium]|nr:SMP-30/gluconolactonase/LRE family protein [Vicinamibacterales bacterium]
MRQPGVVAACVVLAAVSGASLFGGQARGQAGGDVLRLDPALDAIISPGAKLETLVEDYFGGDEGPVWDKAAGHLLFSDQAANRIYRMTPDGTFSVHLENSGLTDFASLRGISPWDGNTGALLNNGRLIIAIVGSNGLALDHEGRLIICQHGNRALVRVEKDGTRTVLADRFEGKRLNGPNDLHVAKDGSIYFTDIGVMPGKEMPAGFYRWKDGTLTRLHADFQGAFANGIALSPDERMLYVAVGRTIVRFDLNAAAGVVSNERVLVDMTGEKLPGQPDGFKVDRKGNLFFGGAGGLWITSPDGKHLGTIRNPRNTNMAFGGADGRDLYIMTFTGVRRIRLAAPAI